MPYLFAVQNYCYGAVVGVANHHMRLKFAALA